jgi:hypothetical protein
MACFVAPAAEAVVTTVVKKKVGEKSHLQVWKKRLSWLSAMLWGGSALLALEHIWHGEIVFYPPFLTAMRNASDTQVMLTEIATVGVAMAVLVTLTWGLMVFVDKKFGKKAALAKGE